MIAILVPVLGRPHQIQPMLDSLAASTYSAYEVIFICSPGDATADVARKSGQKTIVADWEPGQGDYAKKLSLGYQHTEAEWLFQGATDLRFHHHWDAKALAAARHRGKLVVGTNDLGNPLVLRGRHSTHTLIARSYIENFGGTVDGTGVIFSEVYDHQFSDTEFIETAKRRHQFVFAADSIVEHLHPHWGKEERDSTYEKSERNYHNDRMLFMQRRKVTLRHSRRSR
jgi:glycosyltransferase involved in cell wall biosynthesis